MNLRIVYFLKGDAKEYTERLIKEVYKKFGVSFCYSQKQPAHITLKYKFYTDKIGVVEDTIKKVCDSVKPSVFEIGGLENFDKHAFYLKVNPSQEMVKFEKALIRELGKLNLKDGKKARDYDRFLHENFHVGIAHHDIDEKFYEIKEYLREYDKKFKAKFDKVYLVRKPQGKWIIQRSFDIK